MAAPANVAGRADAASLLRPIPFAELAGWNADDHAAAFRAFRAGAAQIVHTPPKTRAFGVSGEALRQAAALALGMPAGLAGEEARGFFERRFVPHRIEAAGFVTGYYEPEVEASRIRTERFTVPLYRRPDDLVDVTDDNRPPGWDPDIRFARQGAAGITPFADRAEIEAGALAGRGLEIAWLGDRVDAFFIHIQGSARLRVTTGEVLRIAFDGKSGHAYTSIGRLAIERGLLVRGDAHKDGLEGWLKRHRSEGEALMRENRSFIFFREVRLAGHEGPLGAAGVPLISGRSLAVDRTLHTFHAPVWVDAARLADPDRRSPPYRRLMVAQDTGSAIVGPARGDLFFGSGAAAGSRAGRVSHAATMAVFVPAADAGS